MAGLFVSLGFYVAVITLYFRWVDDWLQKKEGKLGDVRDAKTSSLMAALNMTCEINSRFHATSEDAGFTVRDFNALIDSARDVDKAVDEFTEWNGYLAFLSIRMRRAARPWLVCVVFANLANLVISWEEYFGTPILLNDSNIVVPLFCVFMLLTVVAAIIALLPIRTMISSLSKLDQESLGFQTIRSWEKRA